MIRSIIYRLGTATCTRCIRVKVHVMKENVELLRLFGISRHECDTM